MQNDAQTNPLATGINRRVCLLNLGAVRALRGSLTEEIKCQIDSGELLWVFDFSFVNKEPDVRSRALKFWAGEIENPAAAQKMTIEEVISRILPATRPTFTCGELCLRLSASRGMVLRLRRKFNLKPGPLNRACLAEFLRSRWIGGVA